MTNSITPPPELIKELQDLGNLDAIKRAYQAGADMELGAGMEWFRRFYKGESWMLRDLNSFKTARRPKSPSLKEQALEVLKSRDFAEPLLDDGSRILQHDELDTILRAVEALPND